MTTKTVFLLFIEINFFPIFAQFSTQLSFGKISALDIFSLIFFKILLYQKVLIFSWNQTFDRECIYKASLKKTLTSILSPVLSN